LKVAIFTVGPRSATYHCDECGRQAGQTNPLPPEKHSKHLNKTKVGWWRSPDELKWLLRRQAGFSFDPDTRH
jgi:hypothetical protein